MSGYKLCGEQVGPELRKRVSAYTIVDSVVSYKVDNVCLNSPSWKKRVEGGTENKFNEHSPCLLSRTRLADRPYIRQLSTYLPPRSELTVSPQNPSSENDETYVYNQISTSPAPIYLISP